MAVGTSMGVAFFRLYAKWFHENKFEKFLNKLIGESEDTYSFYQYRLLINIVVCIHSLLATLSTIGYLKTISKKIDLSKNKKIVSYPKLNNALIKAIEIYQKYVTNKINIAFASGKVSRVTEMNMFCLPSYPTIIITTVGSNLWEKHFTEDEITAVLLHELGHALTVKKYSLPTMSLSIIVSIIDNLPARDPIADILKGLSQSYKNMYVEVLADSFAVHVGYAEPLKKALLRLRKLYKQFFSENNDSQNLSFVKPYINHLYDLDNRIKMIEKSEKARKEFFKKYQLQIS